MSSVAKDLGVANAAGRARRTQAQAKRLRKGSARGNRLHSLRVRSVAHRVRVSKMGSLSASAPKPPRPVRGRNLAASTLFSA